MKIGVFRIISFINVIAKAAFIIQKYCNKRIIVKYYNLNHFLL